MVVFVLFIYFFNITNTIEINNIIIQIRMMIEPQSAIENDSRMGKTTIIIQVIFLNNSVSSFATDHQY